MYTLEFTIITYPYKTQVSDIDLEVDKDGNALSLSINGSEIKGWEKYADQLFGRKLIERLTLIKLDLEKAL